MFKEEFDTSYVGFMKDGARWLVENTDIKLVGKIYAVFDGFQTPFLTFICCDKCLIFNLSFEFVFHI